MTINELDYNIDKILVSLLIEHIYFNIKEAVLKTVFNILVIHQPIIDTQAWLTKVIRVVISP